MQKNFDTWNIKKKEIQRNGYNKFYHPRDIWWCSLGVNIGSEQDGKDKDFQRPVLILKGFSKDTCLVVPLSTSVYPHKYRFNIGSVTGRESCVVLSQLKIVDTKRLVNKIVVLNKITFEAIKKSLKDEL